MFAVFAFGIALALSLAADEEELPEVEAVKAADLAAAASLAILERRLVVCEEWDRIQSGSARIRRKRSKTYSAFSSSLID